MKKEFEHLLFTRVNVGYREKIWLPYEDPEKWLKYRLDVFFKTCFPSVIAQTNKEFKWYLYFVSQTPKMIMDMVYEKFKPFNFINILIKEETVKNFYNYHKNDLNNIVDKEYEYLITSNIDTDDMLHINYIATVQQFFNRQEYLPINFNNGIFFDLKSNVMCSSEHKSNVFISLIEKRKELGFLGAISRNHTDFYRISEKLEVNNDIPMWCVTMHDFNVSTKFYGKLKFFVKCNLELKFNYNNYNKASLVDEIQLLFLYSYKRFKENKSEFRRFLFRNLK
ncbi:glycosyltransferase [Algoriphagus halophytocola]|uniref:glycosyltransferase n=1 Tax=Algoriphagus halophytocola TaxID=2991499 RepID=UPI0022DE6679|nr:glycosyltransferase [Algoriphagus sp. TR-M9]WBL41306.1 glycosyltransferase [Algoriphagus sp. TR-M9]